jgi:hypothetical protein
MSRKIKQFYDEDDDYYDYNDYDDHDDYDDNNEGDPADSHIISLSSQTIDLGSLAFPPPQPLELPPSLPPTPLEHKKPKFDVKLPLFKAFQEIVLSAKVGKCARTVSSSQKLFIEDLPSDALLLLSHFLPLSSLGSLCTSSKVFSSIYSLPALFVIGTELTHPDIANQAALHGVRHISPDSCFIPLKNPPEVLCKSVRKYAFEAANLHIPPATTFKLGEAEESFDLRTFLLANPYSVIVSPPPPSLFFGFRSCI